MNVKEMTFLCGFILGLVTLPGSADDDICSSFPPCKVCGDKEYLLSFFINFYKQYGDIYDINRNLLKSIEEEHDFYSQAFIDNYGVFIFSRLIPENSQESIKILEYLLKKGVHPYESQGEGSLLIMIPVAYNYKESFDMLVESGKLTDCIEKLKETYQYALLMKNQYYAEELKKLLEKVEQDENATQVEPE